MKFAQHLQAHITPEWHKQYILYDEMKVILYDRIRSLPSEEDIEERGCCIQEFENEFFEFCQQEVEKINSFFEEKLAESSRKLHELKAQLRAISNPNHHHIPKPGHQREQTFFKPNSKSEAKIKSGLKLAFSEAYLGLVLLQNYQRINYTGFRKILKKHDKLLMTTNGRSWMRRNVDSLPFHRDTSVEFLIQQIEDSVTNHLENGNRSKAMNRLRVPPLLTTKDMSPTFVLGFMIGALLVITIKIGISLSYNLDNYDWKTIVRLYRGPFLLNLFIFLIGLNTYAWRSHGVNHILIFEIDPRNHLTVQNILELAVFLNCVWGGSLLLYLRSKDIEIPIYASPLALLVFYFSFLFNPFQVLWYSGRIWLIKKLWRIITAPFHPVGFADFWLADQLSSLTQVLLDLQYIICLYFHWETLTETEAISAECSQFCFCNSPRFYLRPIIRCIPAWIRILQCFRRYYDSGHANPHLFNALKYACTCVVVLMSTLDAHLRATTSFDFTHNIALVFWILFAIISSCYSYYWDVKRDWGLFDRNCGENRFLREEIVYSSKWYYYFAIVGDIFLRFSWALQISLTETGYSSSEVMATILAPLELIRRFIWNFFRLENEHLNNCGEFRAVRDIFVVRVAPKDEDDSSSLDTTPYTPTPSSPSDKRGKRRFTFTFSPATFSDRKLDSQAPLAVILDENCNVIDENK